MPGPIKHSMIMLQASLPRPFTEWMGKALVCCRVLCISHYAPGRLLRTVRNVQGRQGQVSICFNQSLWASKVITIEVRAGLVLMMAPKIPQTKPTFLVPFPAPTGAHVLSSAE